MDIDFIDHFAITVTNLQRSFDWYNKVFGFQMFHQWPTTWMVRRGNMRIGLFERPTATPIDNLDSKIAFQHVAFHVTADAFIQAQIGLAALNVAIETLEDTGVAYSLFIRDPDGHLLELTTYHDAPNQAA